MSDTLTPWADQRRRVGLYSLVRVIHVDEGRQEFVALNPKLTPKRDDVRDLEFDGRTFFHPVQKRTAEERIAILRRFDAAYWADDKNKQTRFSVLDRERRLLY